MLIYLTAVYPVYKSTRVIRKQEDPALKLKLLKFWTIVFVMEVFKRNFGFLLNSLEMHSAFFIVFYLVITVRDFRYAELIYHFVFEEFILRNKDTITEYRRALNNKFELYFIVASDFVK